MPNSNIFMIEVSSKEMSANPSKTGTYEMPTLGIN